MEIKGKFNTAKIFTDNIEEEAILQIKNICDSGIFEKSKIRIMPDVHSGKGCVIGFTAEIGPRINPNLIGVDIGCGMYSVNLGRVNISYDKLDKFIIKNIPHGFAKNSSIDESIDERFIEKVRKISERIGTKSGENLKAAGSLGSGNHFIEIDIDSKGNKWLIIHSGSRGFGLSIAEYYQNKAVEYIRENSIEENIPYLENEMLEEYLEAMVTAQEFASVNRKIISGRIVKFLKIDSPLESFETIHNYYNPYDKIIRKGAISANAGEKIVIPLNMRDGIILAVGKGNSDWNFSAPHGAGRKMSRSKARKNIELDEFRRSMKNVWSSTVSEKTIDEAPQAYKSKKEIIDNLAETAEIIEVMTPSYNFKSS